MVLESQPFMIKAEEVKHGGVQVINVDFAIDRVVSEVVGHSMDDSSLDAATGHPHRKSMLIVLATVAILSVRRASEFTAPHDERVIKQTA